MDFIFFHFIKNMALAQHCTEKVFLICYVIYLGNWKVFNAAVGTNKVFFTFCGAAVEEENSEKKNLQLQSGAPAKLYFGDRSNRIQYLIQG